MLVSEILVSIEGREAGEVDGLSKKEKEREKKLIDLDNSMLIVGGRGGWRWKRVQEG